MPAIFLSPSTQDKNIGADGITEKERMRALASALAKVLEAKGYQIFISAPDSSLTQAIRESAARLIPRQGDIHLALHSNAAPKPGTATGMEAWVFSRGGKGDRLGGEILRSLRTVLDLPVRAARDGGLCKVIGADGPKLYEISHTTAPAALIELFFHDNMKDVRMFTSRWPMVVQALADGIDSYYGR